jgi:hypothetical protein
MELAKAAKILNKLLAEKQPKTFSSSWILLHAPQIYRYARLNLRTEDNRIDWDKLTPKLNRKFQRRWIRYRRKKVKSYKNQHEVNLILNKHKDKLYILIVPVTKADYRLRERILISLVRISQKGNVLAQQELAKWLMFILEDWIDRYYYIRIWKGYTDLIQERIQSCVRCYKYTGSFIGYLYKTLEYSGRGICFLQKYSFDDLVLDGSKRRIDYFVQEVHQNSDS